MGKAVKLFDYEITPNREPKRVSSENEFCKCGHRRKFHVKTTRSCYAMKGDGRCRNVEDFCECKAFTVRRVEG